MTVGAGTGGLETVGTAVGAAVGAHQPNWHVASHMCGCAHVGQRSVSQNEACESYTAQLNPATTV